MGRPGRVRLDPHPDLTDAETAARRLEASKRRRGYG
nr:hypothetical protein [uncultured Rhodopila sp.]